MTILIGILTFVLIVISILLVLLVLAQKTKDGGMGAALGGGMTESTFGADTGNVLSKTTINLSIAFFVLGFFLFLGHIYVRNHAGSKGDLLPTIAAPAAPAAPAAKDASPAAAPATGSAPAVEVPKTAPVTEPKKS